MQTEEGTAARDGMQGVLLQGEVCMGHQGGHRGYCCSGRNSKQELQVHDNLQGLGC